MRIRNSRNSIVAIATASVLTLILSSAVNAEPAKAPSPKKALQAAARNLQKSDNYLAKVEIVGGLSERDDHQVTEKTVGESYRGEVFTSRGGSLMHIPCIESQTMSGVKVFRYPSHGVAFVQGAWRDIFSDRSTVRLARLFSFPEVILARALAGGNEVVWLSPEEEKARLGDRTFGREDDPGSAGDKPVTKKGDGAKGGAKRGSPTVAVAPSTSERMPRIVRVVVPPSEALKHFTEVQNSGCMGGG